MQNIKKIKSIILSSILLIAFFAVIFFVFAKKENGVILGRNTQNKVENVAGLEKQDDVDRAMENSDAKNTFGKIDRIILITTESTRFDHLGYMGYPRNTTPFLDKLSGESVVFENMFTSIPITKPSLTAIFTSLYPTQSKVFVNSSVLNEKYKTLAEYLKEKDFLTAAFTSASTLSKGNLEQGFDVYEKVEEITGGDYMRGRHQNAEETMRLAYNWLEKRNSDEKFFLWIHLDDPHREMLEVAPMFKVSERDRISQKEKMLDFWEKNQHINLEMAPSLGAGFLSQQVQAGKSKKDTAFEMIGHYDGAINLLDSQIEKLYSYFNERELKRNSLWFVMADHGEGLGSHGGLGHQENIYQEQLRTPLIMHSPDNKNAMEVFELAENIDILPTLADVVGFNLDKNFVSGQSLLETMAGKSEKEYVFSMTPTFRQFALQSEKYKYIYYDQDMIEFGEKKDYDAFFDLKNDPYEQINARELYPDVQKEMKSRLYDIAIGFNLQD